MHKTAIEMTEKVLNGGEISAAEGLKILNAQGSEYTHFMAGAHSIKEQAHGSSIDLCSIINAKSGRCAENCSFCAQSAHHQAETPVYDLKSCEEMVQGAVEAEKAGNHCYGIVTSGTSVGAGEEFNRITEAIGRIARETAISPSASLGILNAQSAAALAAAGCVTYHHNLETARSFFPEICTTHDYEDDVATVRIAKQSGMQVCSGGIFGLGESLEQRVEMGITLRELDVDSVPLNFLNPIPGTPLENNTFLKPLDCLRIVTLYRYLLPAKRVTVCGGREVNLRDFQSAIFMAGASGTMVGNYLTTSGRDHADDIQMLKDAEVQINACH
jgi:biotin synthase